MSKRSVSIKRSNKRSNKRSKTRRNGTEPRKRSTRKRSGLCKQRLSEKIAINMKEGYKSREQAIAVAYSQVGKMYPHCKRFLAKK